MPMLNKFFLGLIATMLLGWFFHAGLGFGNRFVDQLETNTKQAVAQTPGANGVAARFERDGALSRVAMLSGPQFNATERERIRLAILAATPGLFDARWVKDETASTVVRPDDGTVATPEAVQSCQAQVEKALAGKTIEFLNGSALLAADAAPLLDGVAAALGPCANMRIAVIGHTDAAGGTARNMRLSEERANAVVEALMARGVPGTRLVPSGKGETKPIDAAATPQAYARNRRIEFAIAAKNDPRKI